MVLGPFLALNTSPAVASGVPGQRRRGTRRDRSRPSAAAGGDPPFAPAGRHAAANLSPSPYRLRMTCFSLAFYFLEAAVPEEPGFMALEPPLGGGG